MKNINFSIGIIGCGNMGSAILRGLLSKGVVHAESILLNDIDKRKLEDLSLTSGCSKADLDNLVPNSDYIIIAVKPQDSEKLLKTIASMTVNHTIISVMAGITIEKISKIMGVHTPIVRVMPNMGALVKHSMTAIAFNQYVSNRDIVFKIFSSIGSVLEVEEKDMDAVTAVSGSGPAYLFYMASACFESAKKMGLKESVARELIVETLYGASTILRHEKIKSFNDLIAGVASKGGTTEAALNVFNKKGLNDIFIDALSQAKKRSEELNQKIV
ncbi:pyrroline-5-carboxylate reductase [Candidatus Omnitrophus magneticus]|uniref:Pyrroline-5-carboxylate reductase n=1 Tax=Candidatus Omnitrophus magneticus TaxID=1609969 RepID=A0A0F0CP35_9BACT|nr:pyrroline-5-carboxylate reductase [Candidatus Omnitrophus magneticus]